MGVRTVYNTVQYNVRLVVQYRYNNNMNNMNSRWSGDSRYSYCCSRRRVPGTCNVHYAYTHILYYNNTTEIIIYYYNIKP